MKREKGFTLIELVIIILIIATLGALALPMFDLTGSRAAAAGRKLLSDLRYAQQLANATQSRSGVILNSSTQYTVFQNNDSGIAATDPLKGGNYIVNMNGDFSGVTLSNTFTGNIVRFDSLGVPYEGTNGSQSSLGSAKTISVIAGGVPVKTITVEPATGKIWMN